MTITLYSGVPGSGKSLDAARTIYTYLKYRKSKVIANFEVNVNENWEGSFTHLPNNSLTIGNIDAIASYYWASRKFAEDEILLVVDECQCIWNSRNWQDRGNFDGSGLLDSRMDWIEFFTQHRKYGIKIVLIAQSDIMIDKQFRTLLEYEYQHRKVSKVGLGGKMLSLVTFGELFYCNQIYYPTRTKLGGEFFRYNRKYAQMYDSYSKFERGGGARSAAPAR